MGDNTVFGRVSPHQKKDMVAALQRRGHTVAMTGDGVNDVLALKEADLGIAMNSAAPATKAVARLVLLDGRFDRLPGVVAEGRRVIANIERVSKLFLSKTAYSIAIAVSFGLLNLQFPFLPRQLSFTDGLTIGIPSFFLALMANTRRYRPGFLRRSLSFAVPAGLIVTASLLGLNLYATVQRSWPGPGRSRCSPHRSLPCRCSGCGFSRWSPARSTRRSWRWCWRCAPASSSCSTCRSPRSSSIWPGRRRICCGQPCVAAVGGGLALELLAWTPRQEVPPLTGSVPGWRLWFVGVKCGRAPTCGWGSRPCNDVPAVTYSPTPSRVQYHRRCGS